MALVFLEEDPWLLEYESCEKLHRDIMEQLTQRQKYPRTSENYSQISANVRLRLKQYNNEVGQLEKKLNDTPAGNITAEETERRARQIEYLKTKNVQMQKIFDDQVVSKMLEEKRQLIGSSPWGDDSYRDVEAASIANASISDMRSNQKNMLKEQEQGLENLSQIISRQKDIAHTISNEVDYHNELLDDLGTQIDRTDTRVRTETQHVGVISQKDNTCTYWIVIIILFIGIVTVAVI
ncbi:unnamed protein product [Callosobruchus maculatus]|uniref:t-SNARE coiled-coil homology domain-containing protein n=2 Tax=Callosobruchus maculatus TaxID=64391 RepID=A0A653CD47_CALMS|nr:unnamed protein product [Callosobruchus maculatus]